MNEIETKRKEFEDESKKINLRTLNREYINFGTVWRFRENCISFGTKQGVELAQKEFSEIIDDELRIRQSLKPQTNAHLDRFANHLKTRLKQSLTRLKQSLNSPQSVSSTQHVDKYKTNGVASLNSGTEGATYSNEDTSSTRKGSEDKK